MNIIISLNAITGLEQSPQTPGRHTSQLVAPEVSTDYITEYSLLSGGPQHAAAIRWCILQKDSGSAS